MPKNFLTLAFKIFHIRKLRFIFIPVTIHTLTFYLPNFFDRNKPWGAFLLLGWHVRMQFYK